MSTLSSSSTLAQVYSSYADNASYEEDESTTKAAAFITACRLLLSPKFMPARSRGAGRDAGEIEFSAEHIQAELASAQTWLAMQSSTGFGSVKHPDFAGFRD